jgi:hypothetical protein
LIDIDTFARTEIDAAGAGCPPYRDATVHDEDGGLAGADIDNPLGAAHGGDGLRGLNLEALPERSRWSIDENGPALKIDGIGHGVPVPVHETER